MTERRLLLLSTSTIHGSSFFDYCIGEVEELFTGLSEIVFIPYARPGGMSHEDYTEIVRKRLSLIGIKVRGIHEFQNAESALHDFGAVYVGGGNTFLLLKTMYEAGIISQLSELVLRKGMHYLGSSAGTNVACRAINNTNDMPIVYPPSFDALQLVPINVNPHYLDPIPSSTHMGESRETRIVEFHFQSKIPVIGLREGSWLDIRGNKMLLGGKHSARLFRSGEAAREMAAGSDLSFLLA